MNGRTETYHTLIDVARRLFARDGYDGTSVRAITAEAGANLGAISYHFGSKRELYDEVVGSVVARLAERVEEAAHSDGPVLDRIASVVRTYFAYLVENPDLPRLMMQELVLGGVPSPALGGQLVRVHGALRRLVQAGQARGEVRGGEAAVLAIFIIAVPVHLAVIQVPLRTIIGLDLGGAALRAQVVEHAAAFVRAGLAAEVVA